MRSKSRRSDPTWWRAPVALCAVIALLWAFGPLVILALFIVAAVPACREQVRRHLGRGRNTLRTASAAATAVVVMVAGIVLVPDGVLPIPPGAGSLLAPRYVGRPALAQPLSLAIPQNPSLAVNGTGTAHNDSWSSDAYDIAGPLGESPEVDTAWFGLTDCQRLTFDGQERLLGWCSTTRGSVLQVIDRDSMRPRASLALPDSCGAPLYLDEAQAAVLGAGRTILVAETSDGRGDPDLTVEASYELRDRIGPSDCLIALLPDGAGRIWWTTREGVVGFVDPGSGVSRSLALGEPIAHSFSIDRAGGVYVTTDRALHRLRVDPAQRPQVDWRTVYDNGTTSRTGQRSQGSGTTPTLLPNGLVAITDNADPRIHVQFYRAADGRLVCQERVFEDDASATDGSLVAVEATGVVVQNSAGDAGPRSTILGRAPAGGFARVDVVEGQCRTTWTNDEVAPRSVSAVSLVTGLVYAVTKRPNYWGINAWYLTAMDARTGQRIWSVRAGIGMSFDPHGSVVTLGPEGAAYVATMSGLVRVRDRRLSAPGS